MAEFPGTIPSAILEGGSASMTLPIALEQRQFHNFQEEDAQLTQEHPVVSMVGAVYRSTLPTYTNQDVACLHVTTDGRLMVDTEIKLDGNIMIDNISVFATNISDSSTSGPALIDSSGHVQVDILSLPGSLVGYEEDTAHSSGDIGIMSLAVRQNVPSSLVDNNGDYSPLSVSQDGYLWTRGELDSAIASSTSNMDDWDESNRCKVNLIAGQTGVAANAGTMDALTLRVTLATDDTHFGTVGTAADPDGTVHGQLRHIAEAIDDTTSVSSTHHTPNDGSVSYTSSTTITAAGFQFDIDDANCIVQWIDQISAAGARTRWVNGQGGVSLSAAANVITIAGAGTPFTGTDTFDIGVLAQEKGYQPASQSHRVQEVNSAPTWGPIGPESILSAAQNLTTSWADLGAEISVVGYTHLGVWVEVDINDSTNVRIRALAKHTQGGSEEYELPILSVGASDIQVEDAYFEFGDDADQKKLLKICTDNIIPFVQLQVQTGVAGASAGQIDTCYITRSWAGAGR